MAWRGDVNETGNFDRITENLDACNEHEAVPRRIVFHPCFVEKVDGEEDPRRTVNPERIDGQKSRATVSIDNLLGGA